MWTPRIPENWVACDGAEITVEGSTFIGLNAPDLNNDGRFLRGATAPGGMQDENINLGDVEFSTTTGDGSVNSYTDNYFDEVNQGAYFGDTSKDICMGHEIWKDEPADVGFNDYVCTRTVDITVKIKDVNEYTETRPINMGVFFIMKVL